MKKKIVRIILCIIIFLCGGGFVFSLFNETENNDDIITVACVGDSLTRREISSKENALCDILIIMIGSNDIWYGGLAKEDAFYKQYKEFLDDYLQSEKTSKISIINGARNEE